MNNKDKGFSLVEVLIVVAILVVLAGTAAIGVNIVSGRAAGQCASQLKSSILSNRTNALGRTSAELMVSKDANGVFIVESINGSSLATKYVGKKDVSISCSIDGGASYNDLNGSSVSFTFDRSSGGLASVNGAPAVADIKFKIAKNSSSYIVTVHHLTGKTDIE